MSKIQDLLNSIKTSQGAVKIQDLIKSVDDNPELKRMLVNTLIGSGIGAGTLGVSRALLPRDEDSDGKRRSRGVIGQALLGAVLGGTAGAGYTGLRRSFEDDPIKGTPVDVAYENSRGRRIRRAARKSTGAAIETAPDHIGKVVGGAAGALGYAGYSRFMGRQGFTTGYRNLARLRDIEFDRNVSRSTRDAASAALNHYSFRVRNRPGASVTDRLRALSRDLSHKAGVRLLIATRNLKGSPLLKRLKAEALVRRLSAKAVSMMYPFKPPNPNIIGSKRNAFQRMMQHTLPFSKAHRELRKGMPVHSSLRGGARKIPMKGSLGMLVLNTIGGSVVGDQVQKHIMKNPHTESGDWWNKPLSGAGGTYGPEPGGLQSVIQPWADFVVGVDKIPEGQ